MANIRSKYVKDSLLDYEQLTKQLKENTTTAVKDLLGEAVRETYNKILMESEDDYEEEEVEDTNSDMTDTDSNSTENEDDSNETSTTEVTPDGAVETTTQGSDGEGNEWSEFEKYKVSDDKYDFSNAKDEEIVKAYKLMGDEDQVIVTKDGDTVRLQDNSTGADYIIDLGQVPDEEDEDLVSETDEEEPTDFDDDSDNDDELAFEVEVGSEDEDSDDSDEDSDDFDNNNDLENDNEEENMNEQRIFEIAVDMFKKDYQNKDVMTNPGMKEPAKSKSTNDWDEGVPHGTEKPWEKSKKAQTPFTGAKGKTVEESIEECGDGTMSDETALEEANLSQSRWNDTHAAHNRVPAANGDEYRRDGMQKTSKGTKYRAHGSSEMDENIMRKASQIYNENKQLKAALKEFKTTLQEAAVTNLNLGKIIKLISENTTSMDEKKEIIARFGKEAKTIEQANNLYESISQDLKKKNQMTINEDKQFSANSSKMINETQIYKSNDLMESLGMMHRICKL